VVREELTFQEVAEIMVAIHNSLVFSLLAGEEAVEETLPDN
jgi:hypothetical protein